MRKFQWFMAFALALGLFLPGTARTQDFKQKHNQLGGVYDPKIGGLIPGSGTAAGPLLKKTSEPLLFVGRRTLAKGEPTGNSYSNGQHAGLPKRSSCGYAHDEMRRLESSASKVGIHWCNGESFLWAVEVGCDWVRWASYEGGFSLGRSFLSQCNDRRRAWDCFPLGFERRASFCDTVAASHGVISAAPHGSHGGGHGPHMHQPHTVGRHGGHGPEERGQIELEAFLRQLRTQRPLPPRAVR